MVSVVVWICLGYFEALWAKVRRLRVDVSSISGGEQRAVNTAMLCLI